MSGRSSKSKSGRLVFAALILVFLAGALYASYNLVTTEVNYNAARVEYFELQQRAPILGDPPVETGDTADPAGQNLETHADLAAINPDYIGWIRIEGTDIDYPLVQGRDNIKYMNTTFMGERNPSGAIFMDYMCTGFGHFAIIHGHNMRDGSMFAQLHSFLDRSFRSQYREITIITPTGQELVYYVIEAKLTDISDEIFTLAEKGRIAVMNYFAAYGFTEEDFQEGIDILTLATCTNNARNERLVVFAFRHP